MKDQADFKHPLLRDASHSSQISQFFVQVSKSSRTTRKTDRDDAMAGILGQRRRVRAAGVPPLAPSVLRGRREATQ